MDTAVTCQLPAEEQDYLFIIQTNWKENAFEMILLDKGNSWTGSVSWNDVRKLAQQLQMSPEEYFQSTKLALTTQGGAQNFSYTVADKQFIWKKKFDDPKNIKIKFGYIQMQTIPFVEATEKVIGCVLNTANNLMEKLEILEKEKDKRFREKTILMKQLLKYKQEMVETEELLYSKFLVVLNAKKEKIAKLESQLEARRHGCDVSQDNSMEVDALEENASYLPARRMQKFSKSKKCENTVEQTNKGVKRKPIAAELEQKPSSSRITNEDNHHYSSDTEVDDTDTEEEQLNNNNNRKGCSSLVTSKDSLFSAMETDSDIPKLTKRSSKSSMASKTQSVSKIQKSSSRDIEEREELEKFNTQSLFDDI